MSTDLNSVLQNPALQAGINLLMASKPELALALNMVSNFAGSRAYNKNIINKIDARAARHLERLLNTKLHYYERTEIEIRLHELLSVMMDVL